MRIGIFDSGLGGLAIAQAIMRRLPEYDYLYLGDTKRVPYGGRSQETIHEFVAQALDHLFTHDCQIVILACNTASAEALRKSQQEYLPVHYPDRRVLGMIIPTAEAAIESTHPSRIGVLATRSTVESRAYERELKRQCRSVEVVQTAAPLLVPLIESGGLKYLNPILEDYLLPLSGVDSIILGCTHYCLVKDQIRSRASVPVISQDEVVPEKTAAYLDRHPELEQKLGRSGERLYRVTDMGPGYRELANEMAGVDIELELVSL
ncbi:MAG: glutamate racemase [Fimbriimonadaceae bacterium]